MPGGFVCNFPNSSLGFRKVSGREDNYRKYSVFGNLLKRHEHRELRRLQIFPNGKFWFDNRMGGFEEIH